MYYLLFLSDFIVVVRLFCSLFGFFIHSFVGLSFSFDSLLSIVSLFKREIFYSDPGLYSRYFDPVQVPVIREVLYMNTITINASQ